MSPVRRRMLGCVMAVAVGFLSVVAPTVSMAGEADAHDTVSAEKMIFDGLVVRPLTLAGTLIGAAVFVATLPFSIPARGVSGAGRMLVAQPAGYTFMRSFGDFEEGW